MVGAVLDHLYCPGRVAPVCFARRRQYCYPHVSDPEKNNHLTLFLWVLVKELQPFEVCSAHWWLYLHEYLELEDALETQ